jgi:hypothetical protein
MTPKQRLSELLEECARHNFAGMKTVPSTEFLLAFLVMLHLEEDLESMDKVIAHLSAIRNRLGRGANGNIPQGDQMEPGDTPEDDDNDAPGFGGFSAS